MQNTQNMIEVLNAIQKSIEQFNVRLNKLEERIERINESNTDHHAIEQDIELWHERKQYMQEMYGDADIENDTRFYNPRCEECGHIERPYIGCKC
jgi:lysyl-tRNA synthetase class I